MQKYFIGKSGTKPEMHSIGVAWRALGTKSNDLINLLYLNLSF